MKITQRELSIIGIMVQDTNSNKTSSDQIVKAVGSSDNNYSKDNSRFIAGSEDNYYITNGSSFVKL